MDSKQERPKWVKDKTLAKDFEVIHAKAYDDYKDHQNDDGCYILVRLDFERHNIEVAVSDYKHQILKVFSGRRAQDIYHAIFEYEKSHNLKWFNQKQHMAYLGKELKAAEINLAMGNTGYFQE